MPAVGLSGAARAPEVGDSVPLMTRPSGLRPKAVARDSGPGRGGTRAGFGLPREAWCTGTRAPTVAVGLQPAAGGVMHWHQAPTVAVGLRPAASVGGKPGSGPLLRHDRVGPGPLPTVWSPVLR